MNKLFYVQGYKTDNTKVDECIGCHLDHAEYCPMCEEYKWVTSRKCDCGALLTVSDKEAFVWYMTSEELNEILKDIHRRCHYCGQRLPNQEDLIADEDGNPYILEEFYKLLDDCPIHLWEASTGVYQIKGEFKEEVSFSNVST